MEEQKQLSFCPKNVRQIGEIKGDHKIYIEDYVITFLNQISKKGELGSRALLLLGEKKEQTYIVYGALCGKRQRLEEGIPIFDEEEQKTLHSTKKELFPQMQILGWAIIESQFNMISDETLLKDMEGELKKEGKLVFRIDYEEKKESIWIHKNNVPVSILGYQIFYDTNIAMQNYLVQWNELKKSPPIENVRDVAIRQFRTTITEKKELNHQSKIISFFYMASTLMLIVMCAMGITMLNNYEKLVRVEMAMNHLIETMESEREMKVLADTVVAETPMVQEIIPSLSENLAEELPTKSDDIIIEVNKIEKPSEYIACKGDSLSKISVKFYSTENKVREICVLNNIENPDSIKEGDRILLP